MRAVGTIRKYKTIINDTTGSIGKKIRYLLNNH